MGENMKSKMQQTIDKTRDYLDYIEEHYNNVQKAWKIIQEKCKDMPFIYDREIFKVVDDQVKEHDLSKLSEFEFVQYRNFFYPLDNEQPTDMKDAWKHHLKCNTHHWQSMHKDDDTVWMFDCIHMVLDWLAMGLKFGDTAQEYYESNKDVIMLTDDAKEFMYMIFDRLNCENV
jgi:hypothetical protein